MVIGLKEVWQFQEIYDRARTIRARHPETHAASRAADRLLDAFETVIHADGATWREIWHRAARPQGNA